MSEQNPTSSLSEYYKRYWQRFSQELRKSWWETVIAVIAVIIVLFCQFYFGWTKKGETLLSALVNISPHIGILLAYCLRHLIKTPWLLDTEREREIGAVSSKVSELTAQMEAVASELTRPKLALKNPSVNAVGEFDEDNRYLLRFDVVNVGPHPARDITTRMVLVEENSNKEPKVVDTSMASDLSTNEPIQMQLEMRLGAQEPAHYYVFGFRYSDRVTGKPYTQLIFMCWKGRARGVISQEIRHLTIEEREKIEAQLQDYLTEFGSNGIEPSQKVGSIPSSKMD
jgi:hypothetical protein